MRRDDDIGQLEIRLDSVYKGEDVYIVAQQATQVYYLPWACQKDKDLKNWYLVHLVSPRGKALVPNEDDYNFDPMADTGDFYQPEKVEGVCRAESQTGVPPADARTGPPPRELLPPRVHGHMGTLVFIFVFFSQSQSHGGIVINEYVGYALAHKGRADDPNNVYSPTDEAEAYTNPNAYEKMAEYTSHARARHGDDFDPATEPLDTEILMRAGGGKQHGRYYMAHSAMDPTTVPTLRQVQQASSTTSSDVPI